MIRAMKYLAGALLLLFVGAGSHAHEIRPALLEITQERDTVQFHTTWKLPRTGYATLKLVPTFAESCEYSQDPLPHVLRTAFRFSGKLECASGLRGATVAIEGLQTSLTDTLLRISFANGDEFQALLNASSPSVVVPRPGSISVPAYFTLGVTHMLFGIDHLLFVLGLIVLILKKGEIAGRLGVLTATVTSFTVAHSITLALAVLDLVALSQGPVEAVIALSILLLAHEIARDPERQGLMARRPWQLAFVFGLLHGFGFAGALAEIGLPDENLALALLFFNLGIEAGQLGVIACVLVLFVLAKRGIERLPGAIRAAPLYALGAVSSFWTLDRIGHLI